MVDLNIELPKGFLEEEVRCGYTVTRKMKEVWAVELDLLKEFKRVCNKYDLKYCADGGTLLGAIRHQGFIPWDDDLDIAMLRKDFEKLNEVAPAEFKKPYFWQTEETDKGSARGHAQLRNSDTTGIIKNEYEHQRNNNFNQGKAMSQFMDKAVLGEDIILKSKGQQRYSYCYIADAVSGLLKLMLDGQDGEAYNISNDDDGLTLGEYAEYIASLANLKVRYEIENNESVSKATFALLDTHKIKNIGWKPQYSVKDGLKRTYMIKKEQLTNVD